MNNNNTSVPSANKDWPTFIKKTVYLNMSRLPWSQHLKIFSTVSVDNNGIE